MSKVDAIRWFVGRQARNIRALLAEGIRLFPPLAGATLDVDDVRVVREALARRDDWAEGSTTARFEEEFSRWNGSRHAAAFLGGRVALSACVYALGLRPGDEVILPGYTCVVVANAFRFAGVVPVFADIELETYGLDAGSAARRITPRTRALLLHHLYGLACRDYEALLDLARRHGFPVIEDCAQATGAVWQGEKVGNRGEMGFYSFEESKVMTTILGGMAVTGDDRLAARLREYQERAPSPAPERVESILRTALLDYYQLKHPKRWFFGDVAHLLHGKQRIVSTSQEEEQGTRPADYGQRMPSPIAALGRNQLAKVDRYNELRRQAALRWDRWCDEGGYRRPVVLEGSVPVFLRYPVMVSPEMKRDLSWAESSLGVSPGVWFTSPLHPAPSVVDDCPNADEAVRRCVNFPCLPGGT